MEKRKLKLNILDVAIVVVIICSLAVLVFNDTVHEAFGEPVIQDIDVTLVFGSELSAEHMLLPTDSEVLISLSPESGADVSALVSRIAAVEKIDGNEVRTMTVRLKGYKKLGRFYTESGKLVALNGTYTVAINESSYSCNIKNVAIAY